MKVVSHPFVNDERVEEELNLALSAFIFAVSRRFVSLKGTTSQRIFSIIDIAPELSGNNN